MAFGLPSRSVRIKNIPALYEPIYLYANEKPLPPELKITLDCSEEYLRDLMRECYSGNLVTFRDVFANQWSDLSYVGKGRYSRCYRCSEIAYKVIPVKNRNRSEFKDLLGETKMAYNLSSLRNAMNDNTNSFPRMLDCYIVWDYNLEEPIATSPKSLFLVHKMQYTGPTLETFLQQHNPRVLELMSIFQQLAVALTISENKYEFEHRNINERNITVEATNDSKVRYTIDGQEYLVDTFGYKATLIDFSVSRAYIEDVLYYTPIDLPSRDYRSKLIRNQWSYFFPETNYSGLYKTMQRCFQSLGKRQTDGKSHKGWLKFFLSKYSQIEFCKDIFHINPEYSEQSWHTDTSSDDD